MDDLKSTAVGIHSSLESAIRESPSNQVSVTLTLTSEAAQDIPNVLSKLADLLRMAAPPTPYQVTPTSEQEIMALAEMDSKPQFCRHCDVVIVPGKCLMRRRSELSTSQTNSDQPVISEQGGSLSEKPTTSREAEELYFCCQDCLTQFSTHSLHNVGGGSSSGSELVKVCISYTATSIV